MNQELITAGQAEEIFVRNGLSKATFRRRVDSGKIEKIVSDGKTRGALYPKQQVLNVARGKKLHSFAPVVSQQATPDNMSSIAPVIEKLFGVYPDVDRWKSWMQANPEAGFLIQTEEEVVGCGFLLPLAEEQILTILGQEVTPPTKGSDVQSYSAGQSYCIYARSIGVLQPKTMPKEERRYRAGVLLKRIVSAVIDLGNQGIIIKKIYARSDTVDGERTMKALGMTQIRTTTSHQNFVIDVEQSGLPMVVKYREKLAHYLQKHAGE
jgi:hypothetical protein